MVLFRSGTSQGLLAPAFLHPLGKLLFGFCMFHGMLFFSQYLPIWYGNLTEETEFVVERTHGGPWLAVSLVFLFSTLLLPFCILISRPVKRNPRGLLVAAFIVLAGVWVDKFMLVVPSVWRQHEVPLGLLELFVSAGFAALVLLCHWGFTVGEALGAGRIQVVGDLLDVAIVSGPLLVGIAQAEQGLGGRGDLGERRLEAVVVGLGAGKGREADPVLFAWMASLRVKIGCQIVRAGTSPPPGGVGAQEILQWRIELIQASVGMSYAAWCCASPQARCSQAVALTCFVASLKMSVKLRIPSSSLPSNTGKREQRVFAMSRAAYLTFIPGETTTNGLLISSYTFT